MSCNSEREFRETDTLFRAIENADLIAVKKMIEGDTELEQTDASGHTPLQLAVILGRLEIAKVLLAAGACSSCLTEHLMTRAIYNHKLEVVSFLIEAGFDVNQKFVENENRTALMEAANLGNIDLVKKLVESGADVNAISCKNHFALMNATSQGHQELYEYLAPLTSPKLRSWTEKYISYRLNSQKKKEQ